MNAETFLLPAVLDPQKNLHWQWCECRTAVLDKAQEYRLMWLDRDVDLKKSAQLLEEIEQLKSDALAAANRLHTEIVKAASTQGLSSEIQVVEEIDRFMNGLKESLPDMTNAGPMA